jgi:hypothetical protein
MSEHREDPKPAPDKKLEKVLTRLRNRLAAWVNDLLDPPIPVPVPVRVRR